MKSELSDFNELWVLFKWITQNFKEMNNRLNFLMNSEYQATHPDPHPSETNNSFENSY